MASQTLRPHRSPSPSPAPTTPTNANSNGPAKLTRQSLGPPPTTAAGAARGFSGLGISANAFAANAQPRHASSSVALGFSGSGGRESLSPRPSMGTSGLRSVSGMTPRPSSEFLPGNVPRGDTRTPEAEQIDQWFKHLASWENTLEEMAAASTDQNFTEELGAIEQWFRVLSEAERTAALYSLLQHSTPVQIRFFLSVLHHMAQSDPMTALLSPNPALAAGMQATMEAKLAGSGLKSPSAGGGAGFPGSPTVGGYLNPEAALDAQTRQSKLRQNRISAPGTLQPHDRWQGQLDQVIERGSSPGLDSAASDRSRSPTPDVRPKSTDFAGKANQESGRRSPRVSGGMGMQPEPQSPITSPFLNGSWASMSTTPLIPMFTDAKIDGGASGGYGGASGGYGGGFNQMGAAAAAGLGRVNLEDARKFRRPGANNGGRNVSGHYNDEGEFVNAGQQPGRDGGASGASAQTWSRSPAIDQFNSLGGLGLGGGADASTLAGLGMNFGNLALNPLVNPSAAQMLALAQAQQLSTAASFAQAGYGGSGGLNLPRGLNKAPPGRRSPMLGKSHSPTPDRGNAAGSGGGAGGGAGVAGPDDVDMRVVEDVASWLRVLRLHARSPILIDAGFGTPADDLQKYTTTFEKYSWKDMVNMNADDLTAKGVSAQGARTKFLKVFYNVRTKYDIPHPEGSETYAPGAADKA